jgi:chaperonin cofactor prefoldin
MRPIENERIEAEIKGWKRKRGDIEARIEEAEATHEELEAVSENSNTVAGRI